MARWDIVKGLRETRFVARNFSVLPRRWQQQLFQWLVSLNGILTLPDKDAKTLFLVSEGRTGSNLLMSYLNSIPNVHIHSELLAQYSYCGLKQSQHSSHGAIEHLRRTLATTKGAIRGCKIFRSHLRQLGLNLSDIYSEYPNALFIIHYRENLTEQFVSQLFAFHTGQYLQDRHARRQTIDKLPIDRKQFIDFLDEKTTDLKTNLEIKLPSSQRLVVTYEELIQDSGSIFSERIGPFIGLENQPVSSPMKKQNHRSLQDRILNYQEVADLIEQRGTFQRTTEEPGV